MSNKHSLDFFCSWVFGLRFYGPWSLDPNFDFNCNNSLQLAHREKETAQKNIWKHPVDLQGPSANTHHLHFLSFQDLSWQLTMVCLSFSGPSPPWIGGLSLLLGKTQPSGHGKRFQSVSPCIQMWLQGASHASMTGKIWALRSLVLRSLVHGQAQPQIAVGKLFLWMAKLSSQQPKNKKQPASPHLLGRNLPCQNQMTRS